MAKPKAGWEPDVRRAAIKASSLGAARGGADQEFLAEWLTGVAPRTRLPSDKAFDSHLTDLETSFLQGLKVSDFATCCIRVSAKPWESEEQGLNVNTSKPIGSLTAAELMSLRLALLRCRPNATRWGSYATGRLRLLIQQRQPPATTASEHTQTERIEKPARMSQRSGAKFLNKNRFKIAYGIFIFLALVVPIGLAGLAQEKNDSGVEASNPSVPPAGDDSNYADSTDGDSSSVDTTESGSVSQPSLSGQSGDSGFADLARSSTPTLVYESDRDLETVGQGICDDLELTQSVGETARGVASLGELVDVSLTVEQWARLVGDAIGAICPENAYLTK